MNSCDSYRAEANKLSLSLNPDLLSAIVTRVVEDNSSPERMYQ